MLTASGHREVQGPFEAVYDPHGGRPGPEGRVACPARTPQARGSLARGRVAGSWRPRIGVFGPTRTDPRAHTSFACLGVGPEVDGLCVHSWGGVAAINEVIGAILLESSPCVLHGLGVRVAMEEQRTMIRIAASARGTGGEGGEEYKRKRKYEEQEKEKLRGAGAAGSTSRCSKFKSERRRRTQHGQHGGSRGSAAPRAAGWGAPHGAGANAPAGPCRSCTGPPAPSARARAPPRPATHGAPARAERFWSAGVRFPARGGTGVRWERAESRQSIAEISGAVSSRFEPFRAISSRFEHAVRARHGTHGFLWWELIAVRACGGTSITQGLRPPRSSCETRTGPATPSTVSLQQHWPERAAAVSGTASLR